jgi:hypothetical protein
MEQAAASTAQKMIDKPIDAWMAALPILFVGGAVLILIGIYLLVRYVMSNNQVLTDRIMEENSKREERYIGLIEGPLKEMALAVNEIKESLDRTERK